jgi:hypothetical protein
MSLGSSAVGVSIKCSDRFFGLEPPTRGFSERKFDFVISLNQSLVVFARVQRARKQRSILEKPRQTDTKVAQNEQPDPRLSSVLGHKRNIAYPFLF